MQCYATLFVSWLIADNGYFEELLRRGLWPEVGLQHGGFDLPPAWHRETAARIKDQGLRCSIHLPFDGVRTGTADAKRWRLSQDILMRALDLAAIYEPDHLIGHPEFRPGLDSLTSVQAASDLPSAEAKNIPSEQWLERSAQAWAEVLEASPARLYLENTSDLSPEALTALVDRLPPRAALCLDLGHWHYAADGCRRRDLDSWIAAFAPRLAHLHLHDNDGGSDQHRGIGFGGIDYGEVLRLLKADGLRPTFTLEAHRLADLEQSLSWLGHLPADAPLAI